MRKISQSGAPYFCAFISLFFSLRPFHLSSGRRWEKFSRGPQLSGWVLFCPSHLNSFYWPWFLFRFGFLYLSKCQHAYSSGRLSSFRWMGANICFSQINGINGWISLMAAVVLVLECWFTPHHPLVLPPSFIHSFIGKSLFFYFYF